MAGSRFPIDITPARLVEFYGTINAICSDEVGRVPTWGDPNDPMPEIMELMAFQGMTGEQLRAWLRASEEAEAYRARTGRP